MASELTDPSILDYGNLILGVATLILAIVLGIATAIASVRNRKVHIADKRQDWIKEFRINLSELVGVQNLLVMTRDKLETTQEVNAAMEKFNVYSQRMNLMFYFHQDDTKSFLNTLSKITDDIHNMDKESFVVNQKELLKISREIIRKQANKISKLDSSEPLI